MLYKVGRDAKGRGGKVYTCSQMTQAQELALQYPVTSLNLLNLIFLISMVGTFKPAIKRIKDSSELSMYVDIFLKI